MGLLNQLLSTLLDAFPKTRYPFVCEACRLPDDIGEHCFCSLPCGRCRVAAHASFELRSVGIECPICRVPHFDECDEKAIKALIARRR